MPQYDQHMKQATRNEKLFKLTKALDKNSEFCDWHVTIAFYTAVHYLEAMFVVVVPKTADGKDVYHCLKHSNRNELIKSKFKQVHIPYSSLYKYSKSARYNCYESYNFYRADAEKRLLDIKEECVRQINVKK
jgi:hypothetical protein